MARAKRRWSDRTCDPPAITTRWRPGKVDGTINGNLVGWFLLTFTAREEIKTPFFCKREGKIAHRQLWIWFMATTTGPSNGSRTSNGAAGADGEWTAALGHMVGCKDTEELRKRGGVQGLAAACDSDLARGISASSVAQRQSRYGKNALPEPAMLTFMDFVKESLEDKTLRILIGAAVFSIIIGCTTPDPRTGVVDLSTGWIEGVAILASVAVVTIVTAWNNFAKQAQFAIVTKAETSSPYCVVRDGSVMETSPDSIVVGDVLVLFPGLPLSVDAILYDGEGFTTSEATVTGESDDVHKSTQGDCFLISGTHIVDGCDGFALVVAVGVKSFSGAIAEATQQEKKDTPLQEQLEEMADVIGKFGLYAAIFTFAVLTMKELWIVLWSGERFFAMRFFENLTTAVAIVVVAVPEGLPLSVTLSLAYSMQQMLADQNLVRHLAACETMGGATEICSDKTGTLTSSHLTPAVLTIDGVGFDARVGAARGGAAGHASSNLLSLSQMTVHQAFIARRIADCVSFNYAGHFAVGGGGNKTSSALLDMCKSMAVAEIPGATDALAAADSVDRACVKRFAFSSMRKRGSVVVRQHHQRVSSTTTPTSSGGGGISPAGEYIVTHYVIGAAELVLEQCTTFVSASDAQRRPLTPDIRSAFERQILNQAGTSGYRVLSFAYSERTSFHGELPTAAPEDPLTFLGLVGLEEPIRPDIRSSIAMCRGAGIRVRMVTGDSVATAANVALYSGMLGATGSVSLESDVAWLSERNAMESSPSSAKTATPALPSPSGATLVARIRGRLGPYAVLDGASFREMTDDEVRQRVLPVLVVLARATPLDKLRLVNLIKEDEHQLVAVTGDGTNDAPALKAADVGFSMNSGSDIAKQASDIILLDDRFTGVVKAVMWGRNVRANIRKFLQFQLTVNITACIIAFFGAVISAQNLSPLKPVQLLWLNLIMDTFAALALATEAPCGPQLLSREPEKRSAGIITWPMVVVVTVMTCFQLLVQVFLLVTAHRYFGRKFFDDVHLTLVFNAFVWLQVFNFFNARVLAATTNVVARPPPDRLGVAMSVGANDGMSSSSSSSPSVMMPSSAYASSVAMNDRGGGGGGGSAAAATAGPFSNLQQSRGLLYILLIIVLLQVVIVEQGGRFMSTTPLNAAQWAFCICVGAAALPVGSLARIAARPNSSFSRWLIVAARWLKLAVFRARPLLIALRLPAPATPTTESLTLNANFDSKS